MSYGCKLGYSFEMRQLAGFHGPELLASKVTLTPGVEDLALLLFDQRESPYETIYECCRLGVLLA